MPRESEYNANRYLGSTQPQKTQPRGYQRPSRPLFWLGVCAALDVALTWVVRLLWIALCFGVIWFFLLGV